MSHLPSVISSVNSSPISHSPSSPTRSRRIFLQQTVATASAIGAATWLPQSVSASEKLSRQSESKIRYCLNTSTINGGEIPIREQLKIVADAGYDSIELWVRDVDKFVSEGGKLLDLRKEILDLGLEVDSAIAFGKWIVDDEDERSAGLEQCKRDMDTVRALGGRKIAAPPVGATTEAGLSLDAAAERLRELIDIGLARDVLPQLELWGFSQNLSKLSEVLYVAAAADHPSTLILLDVYHLYKGGCNFGNVDLIPANRMKCLHMNDYPADPNRTQIADKDRVYPGDGIAPIKHILRSLLANGFSGTLSLELFNREYWKQPAAEVAKLGLEKMKHCVEQANV